MASTDGAQLARRQSEFEQAVAYSLHLWPCLTLAVQNNWGGPDSADKRDWFAGAIVDLFPEFPRSPAPSDAETSAETNSQQQSQQKKTKKQQQQDDEDLEEPDTHYVEEVLLQVMLDEFEVNVDDDSSFEVAENIVRARQQLAAGKFDEVSRLRERFNALRGSGNTSKVEHMFNKADDQDQDTDWESDDGDEDDDEDGEGNDRDGGDVHMDDAPDLVAVPREKPAPEVDEDGFTKVTRKKR